MSECAQISQCQRIVSSGTCCIAAQAYVRVGYRDGMHGRMFDLFGPSVGVAFKCKT